MVNGEAAGKSICNGRMVRCDTRGGASSDPIEEPHLRPLKHVPLLVASLACIPCFERRKRRVAFQMNVRIKEVRGPQRKRMAAQHFASKRSSHQDHAQLSQLMRITQSRSGEHASIRSRSSIGTCHLLSQAIFQALRNDLIAQCHDDVAPAAIR